MGVEAEHGDALNGNPEISEIRPTSPTAPALAFVHRIRNESIESERLLCHPRFRLYRQIERLLRRRGGGGGRGGDFGIRGVDVADVHAILENLLRLIDYGSFVAKIAKIAKTGIPPPQFLLNN
jgi:hypothetical protein